MKALAYVSDEMYVALPGVAGEFENQQTGDVAILTSSPRGAFYGDLKPGRYRVTLSKERYGSKISNAHLGGDTVCQFRLLPDRIVGYMWPKWVRSGETAEYRVHASEQYQITLWRYGLRSSSGRSAGWTNTDPVRTGRPCRMGTSRNPEWVGTRADFLHRRPQWHRNHRACITYGRGHRLGTPSPSRGLLRLRRRAQRSLYSLPPTTGTPITTTAAAATTSTRPGCWNVRW